MLDEGTIQELSDKHYNSTLVGIEWVHESLALFRVKPDFPIPEYKSGQYTTLGLGYWEPRIEDAIEESELTEKKIRRLVRRAYSISHPVTDAGGDLYDPEKMDFLEFYIVLVIFLIGLLSAWIGRYLDVVLAVDIRRSSAIWIGLYYVRRATFWLSAMAVVVGSILGLIELYGFTR